MPQSYSPSNPFAPKVQEPEKKKKEEYSKSNPFAPNLNKEQVEEPIIHSENVEPGLWASLGNTEKYMFSVFPKLVTAIAGNHLPGQNDVNSEAVKIVGKDAIQFVDDLTPRVSGNFATTPIVANTLQSARNVFNDVSLNPMKLGSMVIQGGIGMLKAPIEVLTQTYDENGIAVPTTPERQAQGIKTLVGMAVQGFVTGKLAAVMSPELSAEQTVAFANKSKIGRLASTIPKSIASNAVGGVSLGMVQHMGEEDQVISSIAEGLSFAPLGVLFGSAEAVLAGEAAKGAVQTIKKESQKAAGELYGAKASQITNESTVQDITAKIDAFSTTDDFVKTAVKANLSQGKGFVVDGKIIDVLSLASELAPSKRINEGVYVPDPKVAGLLKRFKPNIGGMNPTGLKFLSDFDAAVYFSKNKDVYNDLVSQTGLTDAEIKSHRLAIKEYIKKNITNPKQRSAVEIDQLNNDIIRRGEAKLAASLDGTEFKDNTGKKWIKVGDHITDGTQTIDANSNLAKQLAGRMRGDIEPTAPIVEVPKQNFQPDFGRDVKNFYTYEGLGGVHYFSPEELNVPTQEFFKSTGFLPNEIVSFQGANYIVRGESKAGNLQIENLSTGKKYAKALTPENDIRRIAQGLDSEIYKAKNGDQIASIGILNKDIFYQSLYDKFKKSYDLDAVGTKSYQDVILGFAKEIGMKNMNDVSLLSQSFQKYIREDILKAIDTDNTDLGVGATKLSTLAADGSAEIQKIIETNKAYAFNLALDTNNMYLASEGNGVYAIKDLASTKTLHKVGSYEEAIQFIKDSGQANGLDLDGGNSNLVPPGAIGANTGTGNTSSPYPIYQTKAGHRLDIFNTGQFGSSLVPVGSELKSFDNLSLTTEKPLNLTKHFRAMQTAQGALKQLGLTALKPLETLYNNATKLIDKVNPSRHNLLSDYIEAQSLTELETTHIGRAMTPIELSSSKSLASKGITKDVINFMRTVRQSIDAKIGTPEFVNAFNQEAAKINNAGQLLYGKDVTKAASDLFNLAKVSPDAASPYIILRYARALENPSMALDRAGFAAKNNFTKEEIAAAKEIEKAFDEGAVQFGINHKIKGYLPHVEIGEATGFNPWGKPNINTQFARELTRLGVNQTNGALDRDPVMLLRKYIIAGTRTKQIVPTSIAYPGETGEMLSFNDIMKNSEKYLIQISGDNRSAALAFADHIASVKGIPDNSVLAQQAADVFFKKIYGREAWSGTKAALLLSHAALLGGRLALTLRDITNAWQNVASSYNHKLALSMMMESIDQTYAKGLMDKGINIPQTGLDLLMPGETIHAGLDRMSKIAHTTMKYNGNALVHTQLSAGLYRGTIKEIGNLSADLLDATKKDKAYKKLKIQAEDPIIQQQFNDFIAAGKTQEAADIIGRERVKKLLNVFGSNNNPRGWKTAWGRLAGGMMSWGVNQGQTMASGLSRGTLGQRLSYGTKIAAYNATLVGIGYGSGLNLGGWLLNPFSLVGTSPILNAALGTMKVGHDILSTNTNTRQTAEQSILDMVPHDEHSLAQLYIPYSFMVQDFVDAANMANNDFGLAAGAKATGIGVNQSNVSPLQDVVGNNPRNIKTGNRIPHGSTATKIEKSIFDM
jgi:hypothetical protein